MTSATSFGRQAHAVLSLLQNEGVDFSGDTGVPGALWAKLAAAADAGISAKGLTALAHTPSFEAFSDKLTEQHRETGTLDANGLGYLALHLFCRSAGENLDFAGLPLAQLRADKAGVRVQVADVSKARSDLWSMAALPA